MNKDKRFTTYLIFLLGLFILLFFTKWGYSDLQVKLSEKKAYEASSGNSSISAAEKIQSKLENIQKNLNDENSVERQLTDKYRVPFKEDELLQYFYWNVKSDNSNLNITSMNLNSRDENEFWFKEWFIDLEISVNDTNWLMSFLEGILSENAKYRFFIESFDIPEEEEWLDMDVSVALKIFYK
jgi:hypothetical protein